MEDNDIIYIERCKDGDGEAFAVLYDRYIDKIYRFVYYKVFEKETTEDIVSEAFYKAFKHIVGYDETKGSFSSWLYRIARNAVIDHYRGKKETANIEDVFESGYSERFSEKLDAKEIFKKISKHLESLSPKQREIIILRVWEDLSYKEIAEITGGSEGSVKMAFLRGIKDIREKFGPLALALLILMRP